MNNYSIYVYTFLTIFIFYLTIQINKHLKSTLFNSFILTVLILIGILLIGNIPYSTYLQGNAPLNNLLSLSIVALALPLYEQLPQIRKHWKIILLVTSFSSLFSMLSVGLLAVIFGANAELVAVLLPKSITTPIAMEVAVNLGSIPALAAASVVIAGLQGSLLGYFILQKIGIRHTQAIGLSMGAVSHVLGTVACMEKSLKAGCYGSISLVLCGIMSAALAPFVFKFISLLF
ncbi:CidB/LrgB family autolysis modulator [Rodentibacter caecimuris]|uniref:CidB/LrgB family autolysis modulator n=1 Tax=Rodentibacter caecimuris TaxID=1796644 RepID=A0ABX3KXK1_9PAST|nr:CidB/LrgB family autolysis modulator [Rodentibacter heylii]